MKLIKQKTKKRIQKSLYEKIRGNKKSKENIAKDIIKIGLSMWDLFKRGRRTIVFIMSRQATLGGPGGMPPPPPPPLFCVAKRKKGNKGKAERLSKQKPLKACHWGQNYTV